MKWTHWTEIGKNSPEIDHKMDLEFVCIMYMNQKLKWCEKNPCQKHLFKTLSK